MADPNATQKMFLLAGALIVAGAGFVYFFFQERKRSKVLKLRKVAKSAKEIAQEEAIIRASDQLRLNPDDERKKKIADDLIASGNIVEGARLLEDMGLQRNAINVLEDAGKIDEACQILMRLSRPNRAGVLYTRNKMFTKAAQHFLIAGLHEEAAKAFMEAGRTNPDCYVQAAKLFEQFGHEMKALEAYSAAGKAEAVVPRCVKGDHWIFLRDFMSDSKNTKSAFQVMDAPIFIKLISALPVDTSTAQSLALWSTVVRRLDVVELSLRHLDSARQLGSLFWSLLPEDLSNQIVRALAQAPQLKTPEGQPFLARIAHSLYDLRRLPLAAAIYEASGRHSMAAKCWVSTGELEKALHLLKGKLGDAVLAKDLDSLMRKFGDPKIDIKTQRQHWPRELLISAARILENVDPDGDERHSESPFSITRHDLAS